MNNTSQLKVLFENKLRPILIKDDKIKYICNDLNKIGNLKSGIDFGIFNFKNNKLTYNNLKLLDQKYKKRRLKHEYNEFIISLINDIINYYNLNNYLI